MRQFRHPFRDDEEGAVTVDFVVVAAAVVGFGIAVLVLIADGTLVLTESTRDGIADRVELQEYGVN